MLFVLSDICAAELSPASTGKEEDLPSGALLVALCAAIAVIVALVTGILSRVDGASLPAAVLRGGAAFAGALSLALAVLVAAKVL